MMKFVRLLPLALVCLGASARASVTLDGIDVAGASMERNGNYMEVDLTLLLNNLHVGNNRAVVVVPELVSATDTTVRRALPAVGVYGRNRYYYYLRNGECAIAGPEASNYRSSQRPDSIAYSRLVDYEPWMRKSALALTMREFGCCSKLVSRKDSLLLTHAEPVVFDPIFVKPQAEAAKNRSLEGSAFIDFPVDKTIIYPDYRRNTVELAKIRATIDSVRSDSDVTITSVWLKGYASPESPYAHNTDLAIGRTEALKQYIKGLYLFNDSLISTDYQPEDWEGLRRYVEQSSELSDKAGILALIDRTDLDPDVRESRIKKQYPADYRFLLKNCYPALRHTDYRVAYTIRSFTDMDELKRVFETRPDKLSLNEFYLIARTLEPDTDEFSRVFDTAVRLYPDDETANLNAACAALRHNNLDAARAYLLKAGSAPEADYARALLAYRLGNEAEARTLLQRAASAGLNEAADVLRRLD